MGQLSDRDRKLIEKFIKNGVLEPLNGFQLDYSNGTIMVACSDGDQLYDLISRHTNLCQNNPNHTRIHLIALNGGALLLDATSPLGKEVPAHPEYRVILRHLLGARELKKITSVALYSHAPCGMADKFGLSVADILRSLAWAKTFLENFHKFKAANFLHVDYGQGVKNSYHVSPEKYGEWLSTKKI